MTDDTDRSSIRECPKCGNDGVQAWVLGHWYCPRCDIEYTDSGELTELQATAQGQNKDHDTS